MIECEGDEKAECAELRFLGMRKDTRKTQLPFSSTGQKYDTKKIFLNIFKYA
jgi:hypothetical protein